jgi:DNA-binding transcriptional ArsR family regulator
MGRLLPTRSQATMTRSEEPTVVFLDEDRGEEVLSAVQSDTARSVLRELIREPASPSDLAAELDMSVESISYHLDNLLERQLIEEYDTVYSEKGREMVVYGVSEDPLVVVFGSKENDEQLLATFSRLASVVGPVGILIAIKESLSSPLDLLDLV